ncbi:E3 ubiquitin-protein ligase RNF166-like [Ruditapes philippinarum]|uniref:E3 ubiquitin-protein ligase RNF166-like n=1 Tax=Ruditapes philippinarum TaxID=129788 RepID=UPI00295B4611|nr:E3 ubiquitin-protein ligase RNF166-like [Ruditapes philippinarum]
MATEDNLTLENFTCSICRDIYKDPVSIPCGNNHIVCKECVQHVMQDRDPRCPVCRAKFRTSHVRLLESLKQDMARKELPCFGCGSQVIISQMNQHLEVCDRIDKSITYFKPVKETSQLVPRNLPNRSTFKCPYCNVKNLDTTGLVKHCNERHSSSPGAVVCPVCASMPWGNKGQTSMNFIQHLNMRHNFEYDTYVDYGQDDDAMLRAALQASLKDS